MSFIQASSNICAKYLSTKVTNDKFPSVEDQIQVYDYGFQVIIGALIKALSLVIISSLLGVLLPVMVLTFSFSSLRIIAGGYHCKTAEKCLVVSEVQFIVSALIAKYTYQYWSNINIYSLLAFCIITSIYIIFKYIPKDTPNKPITLESEIKKFKRWSFIYLLVWIIVMTIFTLLNLELIIISSCFGLLLELFSVSQIGCKIYSLTECRSKL